MRDLKSIQEASQILCDRWGGGYSVHVIRNRYIKGRVWKEGVHYFQTNPGVTANKRFVIDVDAVNQTILNPGEAIAS
jgi:hypothetical protein